MEEHISMNIKDLSILEVLTSVQKRELKKWIVKTKRLGVFQLEALYTWVDIWGDNKHKC